jgi:hypothetical protein
MIDRAPNHIHIKRQETLDLPYLTLLNYATIGKSECSSKTFFPDTILGICYVFLTQDIIPLFYRQTEQIPIIVSGKKVLEEHSLFQIVT